MGAVLHAAPESVRGSAEQASTGRRCPECLGPVDTAREWRKMFCTDAHRLAFHNRQLKRGRSLVVPVMAARITREGDRRHRNAAAGIKARQRARRLMDQWAKEDREAGRMSMDSYFDLTDRLGFYD
jgi:hypothetical protein